MDALVRNAASRLGLEESRLKQAFGALFRFLLDKQARGEISSSVNIEAALTLLLGTQSFNDWVPRSRSSGQESSFADRPADSSTYGQEEHFPFTRRHVSSSPSTLVGLVVLVLNLLGVWNILKQLLSQFLSAATIQMLETLPSDGLWLDQLLRDYGISHEQGIVVIGMLVNLMKQKLPPEVVQDLLQSVPALYAFVKENDRTSTQNTRSKRD